MNEVAFSPKKHLELPKEINFRYRLKLGKRFAQTMVFRLDAVLQNDIINK